MAALPLLRILAMSLGLGAVWLCRMWTHRDHLDFTLCPQWSRPLGPDQHGAAGQKLDGSAQESHPHAASPHLHLANACSSLRKIFPVLIECCSLSVRTAELVVLVLPAISGLCCAH